MEVCCPVRMRWCLCLRRRQRFGGVVLIIWRAIARPFCELSGVPLLDALVKYGHGDQRELGREERRERAQGMYETVEDVRGKRLLLIDDVITTGATMAAASAELKRAGAAAVDGLAIARVW